MKKIIATISMIFILLLTLSSCDDENNGKNVKVESLSISDYVLVDACVDEKSKYVFLDSSDVNYYGQYLKKQKGNTSSSLRNDNTTKYSMDRFFYSDPKNPLSAVVSAKSFYMFVCLEAWVETKVKSVELEVDNDVMLEGVNCTKNNTYSFDVEGYEGYFIINVDIKDSVTISFKKIVDENNNAYSVTRYYGIELLDASNLVSFNDSYDELIINDIPNIELTSVKVLNENVEIKKTYSLSTYDEIEIKYNYYIGETYVTCSRGYYIGTDGISHSSEGMSTIIHKF